MRKFGTAICGLALVPVLTAAQQFAAAPATTAVNPDTRFDVVAI